MAFNDRSLFRDTDQSTVVRGTAKTAQGVSENTIFARFLAMWVTAVFDIIYGGFRYL